MDISKRKYNLIEKIITLDESGISALENSIKQIVSKSKKPSIKDYNTDLKEANKRIDRGNFYTQDEVLKMTELW